MSRTITKQGFRLTATTDVEKKLNFNVNVDGRTDGRTEILPPISHPATCIRRFDNTTMCVKYAFLCD